MATRSLSPMHTALLCSLPCGSTLTITRARVDWCRARPSVSLPAKLSLCSQGCFNSSSNLCCAGVCLWCLLSGAPPRLSLMPPACVVGLLVLRRFLVSSRKGEAPGRVARLQFLIFVPPQFHVLLDCHVLPTQTLVHIASDHPPSASNLETLLHEEASGERNDLAAASASNPR